MKTFSGLDELAAWMEVERHRVDKPAAVRVHCLPCRLRTATDYQDPVEKTDRPAAMISVNFASRERLVDVPGMLSFAKSRRLAYIANITDTWPEMAPDGWNLSVGTSVPKPSTGTFDEATETELLTIPRSRACGTSAMRSKEYASGGTTACAETAKLVVDKIVASNPRAGLR